MSARRLTASLMGLILASSACSSEEPKDNNSSTNTGAPIGGSTGVASNGGSSASSTGGTGSGNASGTTGANSGGGASTGSATSGSSSTGGANTGSTGTSGGVSTGSTGTSGGASTGTSTGSSSTTGGDDDAGTDPTTEKFSFFVTSLAAMRKHSGSKNGFGGDLRFGETGDGAGLRGADKLCTKIAEESMPGSGAKGWAAFLSTSTVHAKDRIGTGPWYDRLGRLVSQDLTALLKERPMGADTAIINDLPNETGAPNRAGSAEGANDDNHDTVTGSNADGTFSGGATCSDYTVATGTPGPMQGHSWPANSGKSWAKTHAAHGCVPGVNLVQNGGGSGDTIGAGGGYGGIYCFAKKP